jgi:hypothetical protein
MPTDNSPIQHSNILIGTYRITQLPIIPILDPLPKSTKYLDISSRYSIIPDKYKNTKYTSEKYTEWKKINGS